VTAAVSISDNDAQVQKLLGRIYRRSGDAIPAMKIIGQIVRTSVIRNFEKEGRPNKWAPLSETTLKRRKKGGGILRVKGMAGGLMGSINVKASSRTVVIGTNKIYAATHQFGAKKGEFGRVPVARRLGKGGRSGATVYTKGWLMPVPWGDIPARPFLMVQDEDWTEMKEALTDYITETG
jgi:phage virion morphogenesis protein